MSTIADGMRAVLIPFLAVVGTVLVLLIVHVLVLHSARELGARRRARLTISYRPLVDAVLFADDVGSSLDALRSVPRADSAVLEEMLVKSLREVRGTIADRARAAAEALGVIARWEAALRDRRWWIRANAAHALGLVRHSGAAAALIRVLDDPVEDVRAAAIEALGRIGDPLAIPELVSRLSAASTHSRVRLVEALQQFGASAAAPLLEHARSHPDDVALVAELLGSIEASGATAVLVEWCRHESAEVRAAAVRAIGAIGAEDRTYYHLLRALTDESADVRVAAAWALGRSGRQDAAPYLAPGLNDEWIVAAQCARALRNLGASGRRVLESAASLEHGELARQMLWESDARPGA